jgi:NADPH:quinone reductase-like Zn-dependent oxidoreductase
MMMRAAGIAGPAGLVGPLEVPAPRALHPDEVLITVQASGVGNWDELMRTGSWPSGLTPPFALGVEAAGVVTSAGRDVVDVAPGDEVLTHVFPLRDNGTWAEQLIAPAAMVAPKPPGLTWPQAAALCVPALTAQQALHDVLRVRPGDKVFVHGAGGVTGGMLVQFAAARGAEVAATAGPGSVPRVRQIGAAHVIDYRDPAWPERVREALGGGAGAAVNAVPGQAALAMSAVAGGGRLATIAGQAPASERAVQVHAVTVRPDRDQLAHAALMLARGDIMLSVGYEFALEQAAGALAQVQAGTNGTVVVLRP